MNWRWIWIAAFLGAVVAGFSLLSSRNPVSTALDESAPQPSYYLRDAIITQTDSHGSPSARLIASRIEQPPGDADIQLQSVRVDYLKVPDKQWFLSAQHAVVPADSRLIRFDGNVELRPADGPTTNVVHTDELTVDTERNVAYTTTSPVAIRFGIYTMDVKRFEADLNTEKVRMEAVHGRSGQG